MKPDRGEPFPSRVDDLGVQVDAEHPLVTEPVHQQRGVVASTGADLQHLVPIVDFEGFQHPPHEIRLGASGNPLVAHYSEGTRGNQRGSRVTPIYPTLRRHIQLPPRYATPPYY